MPLIGTYSGAGVAPQLLSAVGLNRRTIRLSFSERMAVGAALVAPSSYTITPNGGAVARTLILVASVAPYDTGPIQVDLTFDGDLTVGVDTYTVLAEAAITDVAGNAMDAAADEADATIPDASTVLIPNHCEVAINNLIAQLRGRVRFETLVCAIVDELQELEQASSDVGAYSSIATATGIRLDWIGALLKYPRDGLTDSVYRTRLEVRAFLRSAWGLADRLIEALVMLVDGASAVSLEEHFPAAFVLTADDGIPNVDGYAFAALLRWAKPNAVLFILLHTDTSQPTIFGWDEDVSAGVWGELSPDASGGYWAEAS